MTTRIVHFVRHLGASRCACGIVITETWKRRQSVPPFRTDRRNRTTCGNCLRSVLVRKGSGQNELS